MPGVADRQALIAEHTSCTKSWRTIATHAAFQYTAQAAAQARLCPAAAALSRHTGSFLNCFMLTLYKTDVDNTTNSTGSTIKAPSVKSKAYAKRQPVSLARTDSLSGVYQPLMKVPGKWQQPPCASSKPSRHSVHQTDSKGERLHTKQHTRKRTSSGSGGTCQPIEDTTATLLVVVSRQLDLLQTHVGTARLTKR